MGEQELNELRASFASRYHHFKLLLSANNKALEIMSDMEKALSGDRTFSMSFVRSQSTAVAVNVFSIVKNLDALAPEKYGELYGRLKEIQEGINETLAARKMPGSDRLVIPLFEIGRNMADVVGSKMANIGEMANTLSLPVPDGFALTSAAFNRFMEESRLQAEIDRRLQSRQGENISELYALATEIQNLIVSTPLPDSISKAIHEAYQELEERTHKGVTVSLRSSALGEDGSETSFAGQYRSILNVSADNLDSAYREVVASKYGLHAIIYRQSRGIRDEDVAMCVGCMAMVNAVSSGVTYSQNPLDSADDSVIINSVWGLPKSVVDGSVAPDMFVVKRNPVEISRREIRLKTQKFVCYPEEGVCRMDLTGKEKSLLPSIDDDHVRALARIALNLEEHYGVAQDVEWAIGPKGTIYLLQCRPLKQMETKEAKKAISDAPTVIVSGGGTASPGAATGEVFVLRKSSDVLRFPHGAVLVAEQALPRWAALLSHAAAVVTEQGSLAGHLANVAREFGVPAIFGVEHAVGILENAGLVTVDADGQAVHRGRIEEILLNARAGKKNLMEGTAVHEALKAAVEWIVPLNLLDPDAPSFKPKNCKTLHDITRFCHEKAVHEMFAFGREHHFSERAAKQLFYKVPMQWWIINLDDGFDKDIPWKLVPLENIASIPFLSLWEGINAEPWQGPPPMDAKGFMSVLMQAATNPNLESSMPSQYANRNYFMLSKNFVSLTSRFGFHFCSVEAIISERAGENYASFQFKGGAADLSRRIRRAQFVADVLEEFGFRAEIKDDGVFARVEGHDAALMKEKLVILGYLLMHTRQLDMVLANDHAYVTHRAKMLDDVARILAERAAKTPPPTLEPEPAPAAL
ncbi:MAG: pyruvate, water dikinase [Deltaproteobacteria bacterium]|nr:pyruvate, water dikinase [Deltaproteobacteria bacterium]